VAAPGKNPHFWGGGVYWAADEKEEKKEKKEKKGTVNKYRGPSTAKIYFCLWFFN